MNLARRGSDGRADKQRRSLLSLMWRSRLGSLKSVKCRVSPRCSVKGGLTKPHSSKPETEGCGGGSDGGQMSPNCPWANRPQGGAGARQLPTGRGS